MFKTDDGRLFTSLNEAVIHEQQTFVSVGLTPLLTALLLLPPSAQDADTKCLSDDEVTRIVNSAVSNLAANRTMLQEFQKLFAKLQLAPAAPAATKRARQKKTPAPASADPLPESLKVDSPSPPDLPDTGSPSSEHLSDLEGLAGDPINLPPTEEQAPPPPQS